MTPSYVSLSSPFVSSLFSAAWTGTWHAILVDTGYVWSAAAPAMPITARRIARVQLTNMSVAFGKLRASNIRITGHTPGRLAGGIVITNTLIPTSGPPDPVEFPRMWLGFDPLKEWVTPDGAFWILWQDGGLVFFG